MGWLRDETGLDKSDANFVPLTPLSHLRRAAALFPDKTAIVDGPRRFSYAAYYARASQLASALTGAGVTSGDVVATILPNILAQAEAHWGVPATGAVLNTINTRLDVDTVAYIFGHGGAKIALVDTAFLGLAEAALERMEGDGPRLIEVNDPNSGLPATGRHTEYEAFLAEDNAGGDAGFSWHMPEDEWESLALNYTSGTTGRPKGVVYSHRGAYLHTLGLALDWGLNRDTVYLTIVPLFHCNNWIHTWSIPAVGGTVVCCRDITPKSIYDAIADEGVTNFGGAPIVLNLIVNAPDEVRRDFDHIVKVYTAGAPPPAAVLAGIEPLGFSVTQT
ncbi:MAG TPA: acyl-CoA synthetase, partial [Rhodobacterales bacterium]|nr:acyl-CoA synthetase [Rhodobacterales bacterium]